jgi:hypothetical protein
MPGSSPGMTGGFRGAWLRASHAHQLHNFQTAIVRSLVSLTGLIDPPCEPHRAQDAAASTAPHPAFVTIAIRPLCGVGGEKFQT